MESDNYGVVTVHRPENVDNSKRLRNIGEALMQLEEISLLFPVHPRAMKMLKAKMYMREQQARDAELAKLYSDKGEIAWGSQIRSYVLQPYQMVKDHRTEKQTGNVQAVLNGDIEQFIESYLKHRAKQKSKKL